MPNERHYNNELNLESMGISQPFNMQAEQSVLGAVLLKPEGRLFIRKIGATEEVRDATEKRRFIERRNA